MKHSGPVNVVLNVRLASPYHLYGPADGSGKQGSLPGEIGPQPAPESAADKRAVDLHLFGSHLQGGRYFHSRQFLSLYRPPDFTLIARDARCAIHGLRRGVGEKLRFVLRGYGFTGGWRETRDFDSHPRAAIHGSAILSHQRCRVHRSVRPIVPLDRRLRESLSSAPVAVCDDSNPVWNLDDVHDARHADGRGPVIFLHFSAEDRRRCYGRIKHPRQTGIDTENRRAVELGRNVHAPKRLAEKL